MSKSPWLAKPSYNSRDGRFFLKPSKRYQMTPSDPWIALIERSEFPTYDNTSEWVTEFDKKMATTATSQ